MSGFDPNVKQAADEAKKARREQQRQEHSQFGAEGDMAFASDFGSQSEDLEAIDRYFISRSPAPNANAQALFNDWQKWYADLSWYSKTISSDVLNEAKRRRDAFNTALGDPNLASQGFLPADKQPTIDVSKEFAGGGKPPTIKKGSRGAAVSKWQGIIGVTADGNFGTGTETATKAWQKNHGITADGIVGEKTWAAAAIKTVTDITPAPMGLGLTPAEQKPDQYPLLKEGMSDSAVARWQELIGLTPADGIFGPITTAKTKEWQKKNGITQDGIVGPLSWNKAVAAVKGGPPPVPTGFAPTEKPKPIASTPVAAKPAAKPATPAAKPATPAKPAATTTLAAAKQAAAKPGEKPKPVEAGLFSGISNLSTPAKIVGGAIVAGVTAWGIHETQKRKV